MCESRNDIDIWSVAVTYGDWIRLNHIWHIYNDSRSKYPNLLINPLLLVNITTSDPNPWMNVLKYDWVFWITWFGALGAVYGFLTFFAFYKIIVTIKYKGLHYTVPMVLLVMEFISNFLRLLYVTIDPVWTRRILPYVLSQMASTGTFPFGVYSLMLITFYWYELMNQSRLRAIPFLSKLHVPFWIAVFVIYAVELVDSILRGLNFASASILVTLVIAFYFVVSLVCIIFFLYTGFSTLRMINTSRGKEGSSRDETTKKRKHSRGKLLWTTRLILVSTIPLTIWVASGVVAAFTSYSYEPWPVMAMWYTWYVSSFIKCLFHHSCEYSNKRVPYAFIFDKRIYSFSICFYWIC